MTLLDLWPAKHSLKPSEKHRFLDAAETSFAVERSFAKLWMAIAPTSLRMSLLNKFECISLSGQTCLWSSEQAWARMSTNLDFHIANLHWNLQVELDPPLQVFLQVYVQVFPTLTSILELNMNTDSLKLNVGRVRKQSFFGGVADLWYHR